MVLDETFNSSYERGSLGLVRYITIFCNVVNRLEDIPTNDLIFHILWVKNIYIGCRGDEDGTK